MKMKNLTPEETNKVAAYLKQAAEETAKAKLASDNVKDIYDVMKTEFNISPKIAKQVVTARIKGTTEEVKEEHDLFDTLEHIK